VRLPFGPDRTTEFTFKVKKTPAVGGSSRRPPVAPGPPGEVCTLVVVRTRPRSGPGVVLRFEGVSVRARSDLWGGVVLPTGPRCPSWTPAEFLVLPPRSEDVEGKRAGGSESGPGTPLPRPEFGTGFPPGRRAGERELLDLTANYVPGATGRRMIGPGRRFGARREPG